jgi:hypothetical protein
VNSYPAADQIANFLVDLDDPNRAVESDARAARDTGRPAPTGYTGFEGLLNYVYYQTLAVNQFDQIGHLLHAILFEFQAGPCGQFNAGSTVPDASATQTPQNGGSTTISAANRNRCVTWLGPHQPGINAGPTLPPYSGSVCPQGSDDLSLCNPANLRQSGRPGSSTPGAGGPAAQAPGAAPQPGAPGAAGGGGQPQLPNLPNLPHVPKTPNLPHVPGVPNIPGLGGIGGLLGGGQNSGGGGILGGGGAPNNSNGTNDLLNFLFGA